MTDPRLTLAESSPRVEALASSEHNSPLPARDLERAVELLRQGDVIGLPTETVYGLAADGTNPEAVRRIFELKGRPKAHPLILHLGDASWLPRYAARVPESASRLAERFWPGPLTLVLPRSDAVPDEVTGGLETVALRVPSHPVALEVLRLLNRPLAAPSANLFGRVSPTTRSHVEHDFGPRISLVLDGGPCREGVESTIVDLSQKEPRLLRHGSVSARQIEEALGRPLSELIHVRPGEIRAPGMLASHYAPEAPLFLCAPRELSREVRERAREGYSRPIGVIAEETAERELRDFGDTESLGTLPDLPLSRISQHTWPGKESDPSEPPLLSVLIAGGAEGVARSMYSAFRYLDEQNVGAIVAAIPVSDGIGRAVQDRLARAAAPRLSSALSA